jgi:quercetin 2,3-dioxygenase
MQKIIHRADSRGCADHGWLKSYHTFSFAQYYNADRIHFGALRVLNDDVVAGGMGFGAHPHDNMEIISIVLKGALEHQDNLGTHGIINANDVQIMSAGTGVVHSEFNASKTEAAEFLQIGLFPRERNVTPRYDQRSFDPAGQHNQLQTLISPNKEDEALWIHQDAWFAIGQFDAGKELVYTPREAYNGAYIFVLEGVIEVDGEVLQRRDAIGISSFSAASIKALEAAKFLIMDIPLTQFTH